jgi:hypothetical protein
LLCSSKRLGNQTFNLATRVRFPHRVQYYARYSLMVKHLSSKQGMQFDSDISLNPEAEKFLVKLVLFASGLS